MVTKNAYIPYLNDNGKIMLPVSKHRRFRLLTNEGA